MRFQPIVGSSTSVSSCPDIENRKVTVRMARGELALRNPPVPPDPQSRVGSSRLPEIRLVFVTVGVLHKLVARAGDLRGTHSDKTCAILRSSSAPDPRAETAPASAWETRKAGAIRTTRSMLRVLCRIQGRQIAAQAGSDQDRRSVADRASITASCPVMVRASKLPSSSCGISSVRPARRNRSRKNVRFIRLRARRKAVEVDERSCSFMEHFELDVAGRSKLPEIAIGEMILRDHLSRRAVPLCRWIRQQGAERAHGVVDATLLRATARCPVAFVAPIVIRMGRYLSAHPDLPLHAQAMRLVLLVGFGSA